MAKVEVRVFGRGIVKRLEADDKNLEGLEYDQVTTLEVGENPVYLFEVDSPPSVREKSSKVELTSGKDALIIKGGQIAGEVVDLSKGESANLIPYEPHIRPDKVRVSPIPYSRIIYKKAA